MSREITIVKQVRKRGSQLVYGILEALILITVLMAVYGSRMGLPTHVLVVFSVLPLLLALLFWRAARDDAPGSIVVTNQRIYRVNNHGKIVQEVNLPDIGAISTGRSHLLIYVKSDMGWVSRISEFFHGLDNPEILADAIAGFKVLGATTKSSAVTGNRIVRHAIWITLALVFVEVSMSLNWLTIDDNRVFLPILVAGLIGYLAISAIYVKVKKADMNHPPSSGSQEIFVHESNLKIRTSKQNTLYLFGSNVQLDIKRQGKHMAILTGIPDLDGNQGIIVQEGAAISALEAFMSNNPQPAHA